MGLTQITTGGVDDNINIDSNTLKVDGTNNRVGIGTSSPAQPLHIADPLPVIRLEDTSTNAYSEIQSDNAGNLYLRADQGNDEASSSIRLDVDGSERMRIDSSGNVGIGTASPGQLLHLEGSNAGANIRLQSRAFFGGQYSNHFAVIGSAVRVDTGQTTGMVSTETSTGNGRPSAIRFGAGAIEFHSAASSTAGAAFDSERMRIDSSGAVGIGVTAPAGKLTVGANSGDADVFIKRTNAADNDNRYGALLWRSNNNDNNGRIAVHRQSAENDGYMTFATANSGTLSERMRIDSNGNVGINFSSATAKLEVKETTTSATTVVFRVKSNWSNTDQTQFLVLSNGNAQNRNNSYTAISDAKLKENIVDANSQWEDLKNLRVRNYNFIASEGDPNSTHIGLVAQEVEPISPGLVLETPDEDENGNDLGTVTKSVNYSVLYMKAVKALQEAMDRIETLETKVAALEAG